MLYTIYYEHLDYTNWGNLDWLNGMARILRKLGEQTVAEVMAASARSQPVWARQRLLVLRLIAQHELSAAQIAAAVGVSRAT